MKRFNLVCWTCVAFVLCVEAKEDNTKNHRLEKRQDNSFLFFGGWRPVKPSNPYFQGSASTRFPDILSALPTNYDAAATSYYTRPMPSRYMKDIYSYYPRPAIKPKTKKNTPVYMETLRPQKQQHNYQGGGISHQGAQFIDLQGIDFQHLQNIDFKHLQDLLQHTKEIALPNFDLHGGGGKGLDVLEVSLDSLRQNTQTYGSKNNNGYGGGGGFRNAQRNNKGGQRKRNQHRRPAQSPVQYQYISVPKNNPILPQTLPKEFEITPIHLPYPLPAIEEVIKNIQASGIHANIPYEINSNKGGREVNYDKGGLRFNNQEYGASSQKPQQNEYVQTTSYYTKQTEKPRNQYASSPQKASGHQTQPDIEAELIKLSENELKHLLSNLQVLDKSPHDLLKYLPFGNVDVHSKDQLVLSLPEAGYNEGENSPLRSYDTHKPVQSNGVYGDGGHYSPQTTSYQTKEVNGYGVNTGGYKLENHQSSSGYPVENQQSHDAGGYQPQNQQGHQSHDSYENHQTQDNGGYQTYNPVPRSNSMQYEQPSYQNVDSQAGYEQQKNHHQEVGYESNGGQYQESSSKDQQGSYGQREQSYIQVISPQTDENGYRREPVLAVEIQHGQTIEDAIKSLDPETLKKLGTHGENGIEIEVVEVPVDEYAAESKKTETVVSSPSKNSTTETQSKTKETKS